MSMRMTLSQKLEQRLELTQQLKLELKQELQLQLRMTLQKEEFGDYITFEEDEDYELLEESFPYLMLHEVSHPLHSKGKLYVPELCLPSEVELEDDKYAGVKHNAIEIGIDQGAILVGQRSCGYSKDQLIDSSLAITERVFRDIFEQKKLPPSLGLLARLDAELRLYGADFERARNLLETLEESWHPTIDDTESYEHIVGEFTRIYQETHLSNYNSNPKIKSGVFGILQ